jgi:hypothetical protein
MKVLALRPVPVVERQTSVAAMALKRPAEQILRH